MFILYALVHCLPPILGAMIGGRKGLVIGTAICFVLAVAIGRMSYLPFDLAGLALGCFAGACLLKKLGQ